MLPDLDVEIPVTIPENPLTTSISLISSVGGSCAATMTVGIIDCEYPAPPLLTVTDVITPFVMFAVATAVEPIPVAIGDTLTGTGGLAMCTDVVAPTYPLPPLTTSILVIVPLFDTMAVSAADT